MDINQQNNDFENFKNFHSNINLLPQLISIGFPVQNYKLLHLLYDKLIHSIYDSGEYFQIIDNEEEQRYYQVFLIDHALTFQQNELNGILEQEQNLRKRLLFMIKYAGTVIEEPQIEEMIDQLKLKYQDFIQEFDEKNIENPNEDCNITQNCEILSLWGNSISNFEIMKQFLQSHPNLKCIWLNDNPLCNDMQAFNSFVEEVIQKEFKNIQLINNSFTKNASDWAIKFASLGGISNLFFFKQICDDKYQCQQLTYLNLSGRNILALSHNFAYFQKFVKVKRINLVGEPITEFENHGQLLNFLQQFPNISQIFVDEHIENTIFELVLQNKPKFQSPIQFINNYNIIENNFMLENQSNKQLEKENILIMKYIWKLANHYKLQISTQLKDSAIWYINDELGSLIQHSSHNSNVKLAPFLYAPNSKIDNSVITLSLLFPIQKIEQNEEIFKNVLIQFGELSEYYKELFFQKNLFKYLELNEIYELQNIYQEKRKIQTLIGEELILNHKKQYTQQQADLNQEKMTQYVQLLNIKIIKVKGIY